MFTSLSRRAALAGLGAGLALAAAPAAARTRRTEPQAGIHLDVGPLRENGSGMIAGWVARILPGALSKAFAEHGMAGGSVSATINYVLLGGSIGAGPDGRTPDQIVGEVTVNGVTRPLRAMTSNFPTSYDITNFEQANFYRVSLLCEAFASWAAQGY